MLFWTGSRPIWWPDERGITLVSMTSWLKPKLDGQTWRFVLLDSANAADLLGAAIGTFREDEGVTAIVPVDVADKLGIGGPDFGRISLMVHSDVEEVGLTAKVATELAEAGIACNMVAAFYHDHALIPAARAHEALDLLERLEVPPDQG